MINFEEIIRSATSKAGVVRVENALNPMLWASTVVLPFCLIGAYAFYSDPVLRYGLVGLGALPVLTLSIAYMWFMIKDPNRLQSEDFVLKQHELAITERKGHPPIVQDSIVIDERSRAERIEG